MKIVYHKHNTSNSYWDNYSYDEDWYLCDSEEEYQAKLEEYRKKHDEDKNNDNFKKYPCYMPCFYDERERCTQVNTTMPMSGRARTSTASDSLISESLREVRDMSIS